VSRSLRSLQVERCAPCEGKIVRAGSRLLLTLYSAEGATFRHRTIDAMQDVLPLFRSGLIQKSLHREKMTA
jgi:hypothetical protein